MGRASADAETGSAASTIAVTFGEGENFTGAREEELSKKRRKVFKLRFFILTSTIKASYRLLYPPGH